MSRTYYINKVLLHFFNPENDLALAANDAHYTPPASAIKMATDLQELPWSWARKGDCVLLRNGKIIDSRGQEVSPSQITEVRPWGWSPLVLTQLLNAGINEAILPSASEVQAFRNIASRATAADVLNKVKLQLAKDGFGDLLIGEAIVCNTLEEAHNAHKRWRRTLFKQPWSGSGRGLCLSLGSCLIEKSVSWIQRTINQQGFVMAEPYYNKTLDLAMEFWRHADGRVTYEGLSLFSTTKGGVYSGNLIASEEEKRYRLSAHVSLDLIDATIKALCVELEKLDLGFYHGPIGVDQLTTHDAFQPCVEINFRNTMGWVALWQKHSSEGASNSIFRITHHGGNYMAEIF